ncbi:MAG: hypothetical protein H7833_11205 [Magnetococcus sp. DMHC-1]|nr:hypothetical protein [Magnetococcales bacterium]MBF0154884.1 hypothetical protein [Magnetococcales bacterium]
MPIFESPMNPDLFETGMGELILSRKMPNGEIAFSVFLIDAWCLGVKDCFYNFISKVQYDDLVKKVQTSHEMEHVHPACLRKIVESAVSYADALGFKPHQDFTLGKLLLGDIESDLCPSQYQFGRDGKPFYVSGPNDTEADSRKRVNQLHKVCGDGQYNYLINTGDPDGFF